MSCVLGKVGKPRMALKDEQAMAIQHVSIGKDVCMATDGYSKSLL